jgi:predicted peroxiredoxin
MLILIIGSIDSRSTAEKIVNLASAFLDRGHRVTVFCNSESTRLMEPGRVEKFPGLVSKGVRFLVCRTSAQEMGLTSQGDLVKGAEMSSMGHLVDLMEASDRTLFLG